MGAVELWTLLRESLTFNSVLMLLVVAQLLEIRFNLQRVFKSFPDACYLNLYDIFQAEGTRSIIKSGEIDV